MKHITIITPSNIEIEYRLAGAGSRLAAFVIDFSFIIIPAFIGYQITDYDFYDFNGVVTAIVMVCAFALNFGYFIFCEMVMNGQSVGKRIFGLRVIRDNGQPIGFIQSLIRGLIRMTIDLVYVGLFVMLFSKKHKRLGDMAAGTLVIAERRESANETVASVYWPENLPEQSMLTPEELQLTREWLRRRDEMIDGGESVGEKIREHFNKKLFIP